MCDHTEVDTGRDFRVILTPPNAGWLPSTAESSYHQGGWSCGMPTVAPSTLSMALCPGVANLLGSDISSHICTKKNV